MADETDVDVLARLRRDPDCPAAVLLLAEQAARKGLLAEANERAEADNWTDAMGSSQSGVTTKSGGGSGFRFSVDQLVANVRLALAHEPREGARFTFVSATVRRGLTSTPAAETFSASYRRRVSSSMARCRTPKRAHECERRFAWPATGTALLLTGVVGFLVSGGGGYHTRSRAHAYIDHGSITEDEARAERDRLVRLGLKRLGQAGDEYVTDGTVDLLHLPATPAYDESWHITRHPASPSMAERLLQLY